MITLYFANLFIAPQLWIGPFMGLPTDYIILPIWILIVSLQGRLLELFRFRAADWFFVVMLVWIVFSVIFNPRNDKSFSLIADYIKFFLLYRLFVVSIPTLLHLRRVMWILLAFVLLLTVEGISHKLNPAGVGWAGQTLGWVDPSVLAAGGTGRTRWINVFDGPGVFCVVYTIGLPIVLVLLGPPYGVLTRMIGFILVGPLLLATYYTGSRGGFIAAMAIIGLYLLFRLKISFARVGIVSALITVAFMVAPSNLTSIKDQNNSAQNRVDMWAQGVEMVTHNPVFGIGKGNYRNYTSRLIAHNSAIEIMGETGLPGLFLWFALIYLSLKALFLSRAGPYNDIDKAYSTALILIIVGYVVSSMFVTLEYETLYLLLGLCGVVEKNLVQPIRLTLGEFQILGGVTVGWVLLVKIFAMSYF